MRAFPYVTAVVLALSGTAMATPFDGLYRPDFEGAAGWDCKSVGQSGGALQIKGNQLFGVENTCDLTKPIDIRGMNAVAYDAECRGEGMTDNHRLMLMARDDGGLILVHDGYVVEWARCD